MSTRIAVMGAGPGGIASAMLLASEGLEVDVYEQHDQVGGRTSAIEQQGFRFDTGPTFFLYPEPLRRIFSRCNRVLEDEIDLIPLEPMYRVMFENNGHIDATPDLGRLRRDVSRFSVHDAENLERFLMDNQRKLESFLPVLQRPFLQYSDFLSPDVLKALGRLRPFSSVDSDLCRFFENEHVRLAFSFQSKYLGMSPFNCPSLFTILSYLEYAHGVYHPRGGCNRVVQVMARIAKEMGVRIHLGDAVKAVNFRGRRFQSLETESGCKNADALVVNADFSHFVNNFVPPRLLRDWHPRKLRRKRYSCSTFMIYLGIRGEIPDLQHHTIFLSREYQQNISEIENGGKPPAEPSIYVQNASRTDPGLAPDGCSGLYILAPVANQAHPVDWDLWTTPFRQRVLKRLEKLGIVDLEKRILFEKIVTPQMWQDEHSIHLGATFNLSHSLDQMLIWRPRNRFQDLEGVYLVGGGTHPGSGLPVIFEGARISSELLLRDFQSIRVPNRNETGERSYPEYSGRIQ